MNEDGLIFSGPKTQLETKQWIHNMENHPRINLVERKDEVPYALRYFEGSAATWWKMHQAIQGWNGANAWEEFKTTLLRSRLTRKPYDGKMIKKLVHVRFAEKLDTPIKNTRTDAHNVKKITQPNAQPGRLHVSYVKERITTLLSVTFIPWYKKLPGSRRKE